MTNEKKPLILVVDDNPQNLQLLCSMLSENGYEPAIAMSGIKSLDFLKRKKPDLILLDILMPEMNGFEVCKRMKKNMATKDIPIIFLSAKTDSEDIIKGFEVGGVDYVTKPFNSAELLARVRTHIEMKVLRGLIPICSKCKNIRDDKGFWKEMEIYIENHSEVLFSHGICPGCEKELYGDQEWYQKKCSEN